MDIRSRDRRHADADLDMHADAILTRWLGWCRRAAFRRHEHAPNAMNVSNRPGFSLIVPTLNRHGELRRLFASIQQSTFQDFEVIVVDQNTNGLIDGLCREFSTAFPLTQMKFPPSGSSGARNLGLAVAGREWINFPDDDCALSPGLLSEVAKRLSSEPWPDAVFARSLDPQTHESSVTRFSTRPQWVTPRNLYETTVEFTMFIKRRVILEVGAFDEKMGVGTRYGAEEGADFVLRALAQGKRFYYDPAMLVFHEHKTARHDAAACVRAYNYGRGFGRLSVKHLLLHRSTDSALRFIHFQCRSLAAAVLYACLLRGGKSRYYWSVIWGRMVGAWHSWREFRAAGHTGKGTPESIHGPPSS